ncbi:uncharacterized protein LOC134820883 [Bolinopsis microptera]|uniref:uncharacterized protein LOC134820883 n=1 Tax=Bolinopsis microptera TaxID=2820187 RepID=UPI00307ADC32
MKVAVLLACLTTLSSAIDVRIVSYGSEQGVEPCARVCYGTTTGTSEKVWSHIEKGSVLNIDISKCQFSSSPIILAKTVTKHLIPAFNYQDTLANITAEGFQYVMYGVASSYATLLEYTVSWSATGYVC